MKELEKYLKKFNPQIKLLGKEVNENVLAGKTAINFALQNWLQK